jgi:hypothetical protein
VAFGSAIPTITPSYSGFQNGDTAAVLTTAPTCTTTYTHISAVGSAQTTSCSGGVSSNYSFSYVSGSVAVTKGAPPTITTAPAASAITYGQTLVSSTLSGGVASVAGSFAWTTPSTAPSGGAQPESYTFTPTDTTDYSSVTQTVSLQVNKATLTVTASSTTVAFGSAIPTITPSYSGFQNGDTAAVLTTAPTCSTTYTHISAVGSAQTTSCSGGASSNYSFSYVSGTVTVVAAFSITTPSPLPSGTVGIPYSQTLTASGGSGSYSWGWAAATATLPAGLTLSSSGLIGGTPTTAGSYSVTVTVTDTAVTGKNTSAVFSLPILNPLLPSISGQISLLNNCAGATAVPPIAVTLTSTTTGKSLATTTDSNGNYSFANVATDSYTITPVVSMPSSGTAPSSIFYPAMQSVTMGGSSLTGQNFSATLGYAVSGYVTYSGMQSGQIYLRLSASNCGAYGALGTSIVYPFMSGGFFTINGVPPGAYTLQAWMDNQGNGVPNVTNPTGSTSGVAVTNDLVSSAAIKLIDPSVTAVSSSTAGPILNFVSPTDQGVVINFSPVSNSSQVEAVTSYQVQWSTSSSFTGTNSSYSYAANGSKGPWILNNGLTNFSGMLSNGTAYYFRARGSLAGNTTAWSAPVGPITVGAPSATGSTSIVTGSVTLPAINATSGESITYYGPLYVGFYNQVTGEVYADRFPSPSSPQSYSVNVPNGSNYVFFAILDQNNDGLIDTGDITNVNGSYSSPVTIGGDMSGFNYDFSTDGITPAGSSTAVATTQMTQSMDINGNSTTSYGLNLQVYAGIKLPVAVELPPPPFSDDPAYVIVPLDLSACANCGNVQFDYQSSIASAVPAVFDSFTLAVTYSDSTTETFFTQLSGAGATATDPNSGATNTVAASSLTLLGSNTTQPNFFWVDPSDAGNYIYSFSLSDSKGSIVWQIPSANSNVNGFDSSITQIDWGTDPTNAANKPTVNKLTSGAVYTWSIQVVDSNGNSSVTQESFQP